MLTPRTVDTYLEEFVGRHIGPPADVSQETFAKVVHPLLPQLAKLLRLELDCTMQPPDLQTVVDQLPTFLFRRMTREARPSLVLPHITPGTSSSQ